MTRVDYVLALAFGAAGFVMFVRAVAGEAIGLMVALAGRAWDRMRR